VSQRLYIVSKAASPNAIQFIWQEIQMCYVRKEI